jgi:hypothetical protein
METTYDLLGQLRQEWRRLGRSPGARQAARRFLERHPDLALEGVEDLGGVVDALDRSAARSVEQRAAIVRALLEDAREPLVHRALLQTLLPGIVSVCRQLQFGRGIVEEPSETLGEAVSLASELLVDWAGQSRTYAAPDLLSALRGRLRRWLLKEKSARTGVLGGQDHDTSAPEQSPLLTRLRSHHGGPQERLARLTYARVFEGRPLKELARLDRSAPGALRVELQQFATRFLL